MIESISEKCEVCIRHYITFTNDDIIRIIEENGVKTKKLKEAAGYFL